MKVLKPKKRVAPTVESTKKKSNLPSDEYPDLIDKKELVLNERDKLVFSVTRGGEYGLPYVDIRHYVDTSKYTGPTKKAIRFPLELLYDLKDIIDEIDLICDEKGIE